MAKWTDVFKRALGLKAKQAERTVAAAEMRDEANADPAVEAREIIRLEHARHIEFSGRAAKVAGAATRLQDERDEAKRRLDDLERDIRSGAELVNQARAKNDTQKADRLQGRVMQLAPEYQRTRELVCSLDDQLAAAIEERDEATRLATQSAENVESMELEVSRTLQDVNRTALSNAQADLVDSLSNQTSNEGATRLEALKQRNRGLKADAAGRRAIAEASPASAQAEINQASREALAGSVLSNLGIELTPAIGAHSPAAIIGQRVASDIQDDQGKTA